MTNTKDSPNRKQYRGPANRVPCFDCGEPTGSPIQVFRNSTGDLIDWSKIERRGSFLHDTASGAIVATVFFVHRAGTGCNKGRTDSEVRTNHA